MPRSAQSQSRSQTVAFSNTTRRPFPRAPYDAIKHAVLGARYELSFAFVGDARMATLNKRHRGKEGPTDILSFELGDAVGQIIVAPSKAAKKAAQFGETTDQYLKRLFIHGCAHLKGMEHGDTMDRYERRIRERFLK